jgi:hypothetical protein
VSAVAVAAGAVRARAPASRATLVDLLLAASVFTITFAKLRWSVGGSDVNVSDVTAALFVLAFAADRFERRDTRVPRAALVLLGFGAAFALVYLAGFFNLETADDRTQFFKGLVKFGIHFLFMVVAVAHLSRRSARFYWRTLGWFVAGLVANGVYGLAQLGLAETTGGNLDRTVLSPIGSYQRGGINVFGSVGESDVYRTNALTLDPNHLGIMLIVPLLVLLPIYLRLERGHRLRTPLALVLVFLALVELSTLSRSGLVGIAAGLLVLAIPYRRRLLTARLLVPLAGLVALVALIVAQRTDFFETVLRARTTLGGGSTRVHLEIYDLLAPVIGERPTFGLGLNTFAQYYEFVTGRDNFGPHSYYVALLTETGVVGAAVFLAYVVYLFARLGVLRRIGRALASAGEEGARRVRPLAWGLTAALVGTLVANAFYLTMQMYYFFVLALLALAAPVVFGRRPHHADPSTACASSS